MGKIVRHFENADGHLVLVVADDMGTERAFVARPLIGTVARQTSEGVAVELRFAPADRTASLVPAQLPDACGCDA